MTSTPEITAITLGVRDVERSRRFYVDGLGFRQVLEIPGDIAFVQCAPGQLLALWDVEQMPTEYGDVAHGSAAPPVSLGHNVDGPTACRSCMPLRWRPGRPPSPSRPSGSGVG
ncbi:VOC family protein [Intrasporangium sp.]|uniref:VOC family protein n=1 Tax=Intrasporangium sp. TaxID=1925024 RepID=UPI0033653770